MRLTGVHILLTYQCTLECDHCFVWSGPGAPGTLTIPRLKHILDEAASLDSVKWVYFEGGEPFLFYPLLKAGVRAAAKRGFKVGIVTNGYWATSLPDALAALRPFAGKVQDLSLSSDDLHWSRKERVLARRALAAARRLRIPTTVIRVAPRGAPGAASPRGQLPQGVSQVMFRGRAAKRLAGQGPGGPWRSFDACTREPLEKPDRIHVDPYGYVHVCQGISIGNLFVLPLRKIVDSYRPHVHPIVAPLLAGGPAELVRRYGLRHAARYADACHLCYEARRQMRKQKPLILAPAQMYGATR